MRKVNEAFTLIESATALGIMAFVTTALISLCPVALEQVEASRLETRGSMIAQSLFTSLRSSPYQEADCFGTTIDLSTASLLTFYARQEGDVVTPEPESESHYRLILDFPNGPSLPEGVAAQCVTLRITPLHRDKPRAIYQSVIVASP